MKTNRLTNEDFERLTKRIITEAYIDSFNEQIFDAIKSLLEYIERIPNYYEQLKKFKSTVKNLNWENDEVMIYRIAGDLFLDPIRNILFNLNSISYSVINFENKNKYEGFYHEELLDKVNNCVRLANKCLKSCNELLKKIADNYLYFGGNNIRNYVIDCQTKYDEFIDPFTLLYEFVKKQKTKSKFNFYDPEKLN